MRVYELMTRDVVAVTPDTPLKEVARLMVDRGISGVPVIDDEGIVLGVISESDFLIKERGREHVSASPLVWIVGDTRQSRHERALIAARTAKEAMTTPPVTIEGKLASVREATIVMAERQINRLPVTESGRLVGIITRGDILRLYARSDETIGAAVRDSLRAADGIVVEGVEQGVVTLAGTAASQAMADRVIRIAEAVDGVVAVDGERVKWLEKPQLTAPPL